MSGISNIRKNRFSILDDSVNPTPIVIESIKASVIQKRNFSNWKQNLIEPVIVKETNMKRDFKIFFPEKKVNPLNEKNVHIYEPEVETKFKSITKKININEFPELNANVVKKQMSDTVYSAAVKVDNIIPEKSEVFEIDHDDIYDKTITTFSLELKLMCEFQSLYRICNLVEWVQENDINLYGKLLIVLNYYKNKERCDKIYNVLKFSHYVTLLSEHVYESVQMNNTINLHIHNIKEITMMCERMKYDTHFLNVINVNSIKKLEEIRDDILKNVTNNLNYHYHFVFNNIEREIYMIGASLDVYVDSETMLGTSNISDKKEFLDYFGVRLHKLDKNTNESFRKIKNFFNTNINVNSKYFVEFNNGTSKLMYNRRTKLYVDIINNDDPLKISFINLPAKTSVFSNIVPTKDIPPAVKKSFDIYSNIYDKHCDIRYNAWINGQGSHGLKKVNHIDNIFNKMLIKTPVLNDSMVNSFRRLCYQTST